MTRLEARSTVASTTGMPAAPKDACSLAPPPTMGTRMRRSRDEAEAAPNWAEGGIMYASRVESRCELSKPVSDLWSGAAVDEQQQGARVWVCASGCVELGGGGGG